MRLSADGDAGARAASEDNRKNDMVARPGAVDRLRSSEAVRITNDWVARTAMADPVKLSQTIPISGSSEKVIATTDGGLTKCARIKVMSASPSTVVDIEVLALGARIMARIQTSLLWEVAIRVDVATTLPSPCDPPCNPLATTVVTSVMVIELWADAGRALGGSGALAVTIFERSTGELDAGA